MKKLTFSDRLQFSKMAIRQHFGLLAIFLLFLIVSCILIYIGIIAETDKTKWFMFIFGGFILVFVLFFIGFTMPSSLAYYYEKAKTEKYGSTTIAAITKLEVEDHSYIENEKPVEQLHYGISYTFDYLGKSYVGFFYIYYKVCFEKLSIGDEIPIKFLKTNPEKSFPRRIKLCNELQLERKFCSETIVES